MSESLEGRIAGDRQPRVVASATPFVLLLIVALSLSACNIRNPFAPRAEPTAAETASQAQEDSTLSRLVERAKEDLVQTAGADSDEITLVSTEEVEWGDTSLGCPHPDEMYAQMITPGYFIVLQSDGNTYDYHTGADPEGPLVQCTDDGTPAGAVVAQPQELEEEEEETRIDAEDPLPRLIERAIRRPHSGHRRRLRRNNRRQHRRGGVERHQPRLSGAEQDVRPGDHAGLQDRP